MPKAKKDTDTTEVEKEEVDAEDTEAEEEEESDEEESEEEAKDESEATDDDNKIDYDAEIEKERKGKPDPEKAKKAFKERIEKREDDVDDEDEEEKPITRKDMNAILEQDRKERREIEAFALAKTMAGSEKEAQLIVEKWKNRSFPETLSLGEQIEEAYAITHRKKLIGERNEAIRALKGKENIKKDASGTQRDGQQGKAPKLSPADTKGITEAGFSFNNNTRRYEKKLANGQILVRDPKTKKTILLAK